VKEKLRSKTYDEEARHIIILLKRIHHKPERPKHRRRPLIYPLRDSTCECIQINKHIHPSSFKRSHTSIMIQTRVNMIHSDSVCAELLHQVCVGLALGDVGAEIEGIELVGDAFDVPLVSVGREELLAFLGDGLGQC